MASPPGAGGGSASASRDSVGVLSVAEIYRLDAPGVVEIERRSRPSGVAGRPASRVRPLGSGFVIDKAGRHRDHEQRARGAT